MQRDTLLLLFSSLSLSTSQDEFTERWASQEQEGGEDGITNGNEARKRKGDPTHTHWDCMEGGERGAFKGPRSNYLTGGSSSQE